MNAATEVSVAKLLEYIIEGDTKQRPGFHLTFPILSGSTDVLQGLRPIPRWVLYGGHLRNLVFNIRQEVFAKILRLPAQYFLDNTSGHITAKIMYNVEQLTAASTEALRTIIQQGLITIALLGYLLYTNWRLTMCILIFGPVIGFVISKASKGCASYHNRFRTPWVM